MRFFEHYERSIAKTVTYRVLIVISTFIVTYILTGEVRESLEITVFANLINTILYFVHERIWNKIHWGKRRR